MLRQMSVFLGYTQPIRKTMNKDVLELVLKYPELLDKFDAKYRKDLMVLYCKNTMVESDKSYLRVAYAYNQAKRFRVAAVSQAIQEIFGMNKDNANMQITYAKKRGAIKESVKSNHGRGYMQANYKKTDKQVLLARIEDEIKDAHRYLDYDVIDGLQVAHDIISGYKKRAS
jgi:hypothetical protein